MELVIRSKEQIWTDFVAKQMERLRLDDLARPDSAEETASQKAFRIYEILESFLLCLPHEDLIVCLDVNRSFQSVVRRSQGVQRRIFGNLPPNHNLVWKVKPFEKHSRAQWRQIEAIHDSMYHHPIWSKTYHHGGLRYVTIPVICNSQILSSPSLTRWETRIERRESRQMSSPRRPRLQLRTRAPQRPPQQNERPQYQELWRRVEPDYSGPHYEGYKLVIDLPDNHLDTQLLETPLTEPAITDISITLEKPGEQGQERKEFRITKSEGVRVKDMVAEVEKAGEEWVELLRPNTTPPPWIRILDEKVTVVTREVYDLVKNDGVIRETMRTRRALRMHLYSIGADDDQEM